MCILLKKIIVNATLVNLYYLCVVTGNRLPFFKKHIATFLILLFVRVMVPDALMLNLHGHTHTSHDTQKEQTAQDQQQVSEAHKHCPVEDIFGSSFQGSFTSIELTPVVHKVLYSNLYASNRLGNSLPVSNLRGPPAA